MIAITLQKTLKMNDDVLGVRCSPDGRYIAVALLDSTVKVFHADTLKFFLSLYGHKVSCRNLEVDIGPHAGFVAPSSPFWLWTYRRTLSSS